MDPLRLILLTVGIVLLGVVYYLSKRSAGKPARQGKRQIPMSGDVSPPERPYQASYETRKQHKRKRYVKFVGSGVSGSTTSHSMYEQASALEPLSVIVYVMPHTGLQFRRDQVESCLETIGCIPRADSEHIRSFDYLILEDEYGKKVKRLFSISDVHTPGIFSHAVDAPDKTNGLAFEMQLPGPIESVMAFERLLDVARYVATKLNGIVCDDLRNRLTRQATLHIKDKIVDYNRKLQFDHSSSIQ